METSAGPLTAIANALHPGSANAGASKPKIAHTTISHHPDGSHSVEHTMTDGTPHPNSGAAADLDGLHDKLQENLGTDA